VIALPYDKVLIAARLGLKPESLSRAFAKLRSVGVAVHASHVAVSDIGKLRQLASDERNAIRGVLRG
jgi:Crp-like helix-turn-helix domain